MKTFDQMVVDYCYLPWVFAKRPFGWWFPVEGMEGEWVIVYQSSGRLVYFPFLHRAEYVVRWTGGDRTGVGDGEA